MLREYFWECIFSNPPDFEGVKKLLQKGLDINLITDSDGRTLFAETIMECAPFDPCLYCVSKDCESCMDDQAEEPFGRHCLTEIVRFFLNNGYDVTKNSGRHGAEALKALCWSTYDKEILEAAKLLLDAGADPYCLDADGKNVLYAIEWKVSGCLSERNMEQAALFTALSDLLKASNR